MSVKKAARKANNRERKHNCGGYSGISIKGQDVRDDVKRWSPAAEQNLPHGIFVD